MDLSSADPSETIKKLNLNGSGFVEDRSTETFYTLKGVPVNKLSHALDLTGSDPQKLADVKDAKLDTDGYRLEGDEGSGYTLRLGHLIIELTSQGSNDDNNPI